MATRAALLAALLGLCCCYALADSTGTTVSGYTFVSDIDGYLAVSQDVCDISAAVDKGDFAAAEELYKKGKNSIRSSGEKRTLQGWATSGSASEPHWGLYTRYFGNDSDWLDTFIHSALEGDAPWTVTAARSQIVKKGIQSNLLVSYVFHEVDEAEELIEDNKLDAKTGAPHLVDEAAAIFFSSKCASGNVADVATKRATSFGRMVVGPDGKCVAATNLAAASALNAMQQAAAKGDEEAFESAAEALQKAVITIYTQATLTYSSQLEKLVKAGNATDGAQAEAIAFFRTIAPLIAQVSETDAAAIAAALAKPAAGVDAEVIEAFQETLAQYNITTAELGTLGATSVCNATSTTSSSNNNPSNGAASLAASTFGTAAVAALAALALLL